MVLASLYEVTRAFNLVEMDDVSLVKTKLAGTFVVVVAVKFSVAPAMASVTVFLLDVMSMPFTLKVAFRADCSFLSKLMPVTALLSVFRLVKANPLLTPEVPVTMMRKGLVMLPVLMSCAEMPKLAELIAATMPAGVVALAATAMVLENCVPVGVAMSAALLVVDVSTTTPLLFAPEE